MTTQSAATTRLGEASGRLSRERRELAQDIARRVVIDLAPLEARRFEQRARAHFRRRLPWSGRRTTRFDPFGLPADLLTPTALAVATALLGAVSTEVVGGLTQRTRGRLRRRRQRRAEAAAAVTPPHVPTPAAAPEPTAAELVRWHASALAAARGNRVPEELARRIADAALAHLVHSLGTRTAPTATEGTAPDALPPNPPTPSTPSTPSNPPSPPADDGPPSADR
ncbi:hypothetical protein J7F03_16260 [Streptomyces sp. ISL-43]|uniref:hypothetical protein n=1 Tax=Streptomyces sp. ISL-43 TaxID=2819183 RepID=UPI001BEA5B37|nr:hypothetical protein [Streptomyces sp. ISL-43]MBT2448615.1 hypothetical protein [Streptomyces sp. ISL-43]